MSLALLLGPLAASAQTAAAEDSIRTWLDGYVTAFNAKDLDRLAAYYHPDVTVYEGGGIDRGWSAYRDHHLGPELREFDDLRFSRANVTVRLLGDGAAYVTSEYSLRARVKDRPIDSGGLETLVVVRTADGSWMIRHAHTSSRRRPAPVQ